MSRSEINGPLQIMPADGWFAACEDNGRADAEPLIGFALDEIDDGEGGRMRVVRGLMRYDQAMVDTVDDVPFFLGYIHASELEHLEEWYGEGARKRGAKREQRS